MTIYEKLLNIQNELKAPKSQFNDFGKYNKRFERLQKYVVWIGGRYV